MIVYVVKGSVPLDKYIEGVEIVDELEEKPKSYVKKGRKISKDKINKIEEGMFYGSYRIHLTDKDLIDNARIQIRDKVLLYHQRIVEKHQKSLESIRNHDVSVEIEFLEKE